MSLSPTTSTKKRFSRQGFQPLSPHQQQSSLEMGARGMPPQDATIDIPLEPVMSNGAGLRHENSTAHLHPYNTTESEKEKKRFLRGGRRQKTGQSNQGTGRVGYDGEEDTINVMGRIYHAIRDFSIITRYMFYVVPVAGLFAIPIVIGATAAQNAKIGGVPIRWFFTWIEVIWISIWVSKVVAHFLPKVFEIFAGVVSSGVRKYSLVLRSLEIPLSLVGWAVTSLATFIPIMTRNPYNRVNDPATKNWENILQKILGAATVSSLIFLAEKFIIQLISINYHRKQFNARIKDSKHNVYLLSQMYDASRALFPMYCPEFADEDYIISDQLNITRGLGHISRTVHKRSGSATPLRLIQDIGRYGDKLTSAFGNVASEITGRQVFNPNSAHSIVVEALERKRTSEALARRIWMSFVCAGRESLYIDDVQEVLGPQRQDIADEAFAVLDQDGNGDVSLDEMILTVTELGRERKSIATSMHDVDQAINVLDNLLCSVVIVAIALVFVAFLNKSFTTTLATTGTALLSLSFVFSVTAQEVLGSCIFLFVKHPFDIGDRVDIGDQHFVVEHISLLFTVFRRVAGANIGRLTQVPNIVLNTLWIENISRSKAMSEQITIDVHFDTTFDDIQVLKTELTKFVQDKDNSRDYQPTIELGILGTSDQSKLTLQVEIKHKSNWANETVRQARRSKFMCALVSALRAVPVYAPGGGTDAQGSAANPAYSVTVTDEDAKRSVAEAKAKRIDARLVPPKKDDVPSADSDLKRSGSHGAGTAGLTQHDAQVVSSLTTTRPSYDQYRDEAWTSSRDDSSTLGGGNSEARLNDLEEVKTRLRRASTQGKRQPGAEPSRVQSRPSIPAIPEPSGYPSTVVPPTYGQPYAQAQAISGNTAASGGIYQSPPYGTSSTARSPIELSRFPSYNPNPSYGGSTAYQPRSQSFDQGDDSETDPHNIIRDQRPANRN